MADDRIITLRFKTGNALDTELYRKLETEKRELGLSMPVYVKEILRRHFESGERNADGGADIVVGRVQKVIRKEMASLGAVLAGTLVRMAGNSLENTGKSDLPLREPDEAENRLPGYSDEFPEGLNGVLDQFK